MTVLGTDISHWQDNPTTPQKIDFVKMKAAGAEFVIFKASQATFTDITFTASWADAKKAGLIRGAYHYLDWTKTGQEQAEYFCRVIAADPPDFPPIVDYECTKNIPSNFLEHLQDFVSQIEDTTKRIPIIYTGKGYWLPYGSPDVYWKRFPLWVANWYVATPAIPLPWTNYVLWQHTPKGDGLLFGCESMQVDLDQFPGTLDELRTFCGLTPVSTEQRYRTTTIVNVRSGDVDISPIIGTLPANTYVWVDKTSSTRMHITSPKDGWVSKAFLVSSPLPVPLTLEQRVSNLEREAKAHGWLI